MYDFCNRWSAVKGTPVSMRWAAWTLHWRVRIRFTMNFIEIFICISLIVKCCVDVHPRWLLCTRLEPPWLWRQHGKLCVPVLCIVLTNKIVVVWKECWNSGLSCAVLHKGGKCSCLVHIIGGNHCNSLEVHCFVGDLSAWKMLCFLNLYLFARGYHSPRMRPMPWM